MPDSPPPDLRTRHRLATEGEIHAAAMDLFEEQGVADTTVARIAERVGISPRTFFRYFTSKESAALVGHRGARDLIHAFDPPPHTSPARLLAAFQDLVEDFLATDDPTALAEHKRLSRLMSRSPDLRARADAHEQDLADQLFEKLRHRSGDRLGMRIAAQVSIAVWRACWEEWAEQVAHGADIEPVTVFRSARRNLDLWG